MPKTYPKAVPVSATDSTLVVEPNGVWVVPDNDVHFELTQRPVGGGWHVTNSVRALTIDHAGTLYGLRTMHDVHENGCFLEGRVSIGGVKHRAFTSDRLFLNAAGKLVKIAVIYVFNPKAKGAP